MASFRHVGGDVLWHTAPISPAQAEALMAEFRDEADAAWRAGDFAAHASAADLHTELCGACQEANRWACAGSFNNTIGKAA